MKSESFVNSIQITLVVACLAVIGCNSRSEVKAPKRPVTNQYHGVKVWINTVARECFGPGSAPMELGAERKGARCA